MCAVILSCQVRRETAAVLPRALAPAPGTSARSRLTPKHTQSSPPYGVGDPGPAHSRSDSRASTRWLGHSARRPLRAPCARTKSPGRAERPVRAGGGGVRPALPPEFRGSPLRYQDKQTKRQDLLIQQQRLKSWQWEWPREGKARTGRCETGSETGRHLGTNGGPQDSTFLLTVPLLKKSKKALRLPIQTRALKPRENSRGRGGGSTVRTETHRCTPRPSMAVYLGDPCSVASFPGG